MSRFGLWMHASVQVVVHVQPLRLTMGLVVPSSTDTCAGMLAKTRLACEDAVRSRGDGSPTRTAGSYV